MEKTELYGIVKDWFDVMEDTKSKTTQQSMKNYISDTMLIPITELLDWNMLKDSYKKGMSLILCDSSLSLYDEKVQLDDIIISVVGDWKLATHGYKELLEKRKYKLDVEIKLGQNIGNPKYNKDSGTMELEMVELIGYRSDDKKSLFCVRTKDGYTSLRLTDLTNSKQTSNPKELQHSLIQTYGNLA